MAAPSHAGRQVRISLGTQLCGQDPGGQSQWVRLRFTRNHVTLRHTRNDRPVEQIAEHRLPVRGRIVGDPPAAHPEARRELEPLGKRAGAMLVKSPNVAAKLLRKGAARMTIP